MHARIYEVRTRHYSTGTRYIVPTTVTAAGPREAAKKRFSILHQKANCTGLLVTARGGDAWVFPVLAAAPTVGQAI